ncbi:24905_t:CDS:2, partial [Gigaspora margarita]
KFRAQILLQTSFTAVKHLCSQGFAVVKASFASQDQNFSVVKVKFRCGQGQGFTVIKVRVSLWSSQGIAVVKSMFHHGQGQSFAMIKESRGEGSSGEELESEESDNANVSRSSHIR